MLVNCVIRSKHSFIKVRINIAVLTFTFLVSRGRALLLFSQLVPENRVGVVTFIPCNLVTVTFSKVTKYIS